MNIHEERNRDGSDFCDYEYSAATRRWRFSPQPPTRQELEDEAARDDALYEPATDRDDDDDDNDEE